MKQAALVLVTAFLANAEVPDCSLAPSWQQHGASRLYEGENLYEYMNGNSEGYYAYGFQRMRGVTCKKGGDTIHVDVSEMADAESAYGMFSANRDTSKPVAKIGMGAQILPRKAVVAKGKYYLEIAAEPDKDHSAALTALAESLASRVEGESDIPAAVKAFPTEGLAPGFPRLVPQSVLGIGALKRGYIAQYENKSKAFVVKESSADSAKQVMAKLASRFTGTTATTVKGAEEAFAVDDRYLGRLIVFRKGGTVAGYAGLPEGTDSGTTAAALAGRL